METFFIIGGSFIIALLVSIFIIAILEHTEEKFKIYVPTIAIMLIILIFIVLGNRQQREYHKLLNTIYNETSIEDVQKDIDEYYEEGVDD